MSENGTSAARPHGLNVRWGLPRAVIAACLMAGCTGTGADNAAMSSAEVAATEPAPMFELPEDWKAWNAAVAPFRIAGDLWYVGMKNVGAYAVKTPEGTILIDTGFEQSVPGVMANLAAIGVKPADVKYILTSHAHVDHAGGVAAVKRLTGARYVASAEDGAQMAAGGRGDFAMEDGEMAWPPVTADRTVKTGDTVALGGAVLTAHVTPGHTKGCTTWTMTVREGGKPLDVVYPCGTTAPGYDLVDNAKRPGIVQAYRASFAAMRALPCDVLIDGHPERIGLEAKAAALKAGGANPFVDAGGCAAYLAKASAAFEAEVRKQEAGD